MSRDREVRLAEYFAFAASRPDLFPSAEGRALKILINPADIAAVEDLMAARLRKRGVPESGGEVGIVCEDPYFILLRDALEFPDGDRRTHIRRINRGSDAVAVLSIFEGRLVLVRHFRHAPGRSLLEIPRGGIEAGQTPEDAVHAEVDEEIGGKIARIVKLGFCYDSTGMNYHGLHLFFVRLSAIGAPQAAEGISAIELFSPADFEERLKAGELLDAVTVTAYCHAKVLGLLNDL